MPIVAPMIQSIGPPPEIHCRRIVGLMLVHLHQTRREARARLAGILKSKQLGTPTGQQRVFKRVRKAAGDTTIDLRLETGTRGRFVLTVATWATVGPDGLLADDGLLPHGAGIVAMTAVYRAKNHLPDTRGGATLTISRHALVRMAERADVRTVPELLTVVRSLWAVGLALQTEPNELWRNPPRAGWQIPLGDGVAVLIPHHDGSHLAVPTVLGRQMADELAIAATIAIIGPRTSLSNVEGARTWPRRSSQSETAARDERRPNVFSAEAQFAPRTRPPARARRQGRRR